MRGEGRLGRRRENEEGSGGSIKGDAFGVLILEDE